jgi:hypothetical protein
MEKRRELGVGDDLIFAGWKAGERTDRAGAPSLAQ